jgi:hypothetical protein
MVSSGRYLAAVFGGLLSASVGICATADDIVYRDLTKRVKAGDFGVDFRTLRLACIKSSYCSPRGKPEDLAAMSRAEAGHQFDRAVAIAERMIDQGFVNVEARASCSSAYAKLNKPELAQFHRDVTAALMRSILKSGDGRSKETAFEGICTREEYVILSSRGLPFYGSAVTSFQELADGRHKYARWEVRDPKTQQGVVMFFNLDAFSAAKSRAPGR